MTHIQFNGFLSEILKEVEEVLASKSADYSSADDKLFNFKLAAEIDGITPAESLRGMLLKHITSIRQGLDELNEKDECGFSTKKCREVKWWHEKIVDVINYHILLLAMIESKEY